ncbi:hypothetical protein TcasGA2_TC000672 [Tribolium castaneum]|uniref:Uncharacterized protein n=1 Tax=Tribolium castaneum TaxID=7070 RepID=D6W8Y4_TRICA|nr:hypothetical protein TcasGA2_TC000672 [Tribolium castaneum]
MPGLPVKERTTGYKSCQIKDEYTNGCQSYTRVGLFIGANWLRRASLSPSPRTKSGECDGERAARVGEIAAVLCFQQLRFGCTFRYEIVWSDGEGYTQRGVKGI